MSRARTRHAEILKLARLLEEDPGALGYLRRVDPEDLRLLREAATASLFDEDRPKLQRLAVASRLLPVFLLATMASRAFGPHVSARLSPLLGPVRANAVARRLPVSFLADMAAAMDPRRAAAVIAEMPAAVAVPVARELVARGDHVTAGRLVVWLADDVLLACLEAVDDASLLRIAFVTEDKRRIGAVVKLIHPARLRRILRMSMRRHVRREALDLFAHLGWRGRVRFVARVAKPVPRPSVYQLEQGGSTRWSAERL